MHPAQASLLRFFKHGHLTGEARTVSMECGNLARKMAERLCDSDQGAEVTTGLRKLLEAKDCFVRATIREETL